MKIEPLLAHLLCLKIHSRTLNIMKVAVFMMFFCVFQLLASNGKAQNAVIELFSNSVTVETLFAEIEKQTDYLVVYSSRELDVKTKILFSKKKAKVSEMLDELLRNTNLKYEHTNNYIVFSKKVSESDVRQQTGRKITGTVVDNNGEAVIGASVHEKGTTNGVITDIEGKFSLEVADKAWLTISYIGYVSQTVPVNGKNHVIIKLAEDTKVLDEVIVIGYGSTSSKKMVAAVTAVKGEKLQDLPFANVTSVLQGRATGVIVQNQGGEPGSVPSVSIRGGGKPLYVIDGVITTDDWEFRTLNPNDIESLSVLKDAASLAVYGSRVADGIIMVKTKEGRKGKTSIVYTFNAQFSQPTVLADKIDSYTYANAQNQAAMSDGHGEYHTYSKEEMDIIRNQSDPLKYPNTDWFDLGLKNFAPEYRHSLSMTGNRKDINYYISLGTFEQGSLYKSDALNYSRYNLRSNVNTTFEEIGLKVAVNINAAYEKKKYPSFSANTIWDHLNNKKPLELAYNQDGTLSSISDHPLMEMDERSGYDKNDGLYVNTQFVADWALPWVKGLSLGTMLNYRLNSSHVKGLSARAPQYNQDGTLVVVTKPSLKEEAYFGDSYSLELNAAYTQTFAEKHTIDAKAVFTVSENNGSYFWASRKDYLSATVDQLFAGSSIGMQNSGNSDEGGRMGLVGRLKYDFDSRYYIEGSFRYDGSDNFAPGHRWGFFPSVALAWDITEEPFFKNLNLKNVNLLKLRGSYGQTGTESGVNRFGYLSTYSLAENAICIGGNLQSGFNEGALVSPELLSWYTRNSLNYGIDVAFFNHRLKGSADYFFYVTKGGLVSPADRYVVPLGTALPQIKSENEHRREGFEASLRWDDKIGSDFYYEVGTNMTYYNNLYVKNQGEALSDLKNPYKRSTHQTDYYGIMYMDNGLYQTPEQVLGVPRRLQSSATKLGDIAYEDINGDGKIDGEDQVRWGMPSAPHFTYGFDFVLGYKGFTLSGLLYGTGKRNMEFGVTTKKNEAIWVLNDYQLDYWREDNRDATFPRISLEALPNGSNNQAASTFWVKNASFLRLKNLTLEYDFKYKLLRNVKWLSTCRANITGANLFTISNVMDYFDPETTSTNGGYPVQRVYSLGVTIGF